MLKEWIQVLLEEPMKVNELLSGKLQLAGMPAAEQLALKDTFLRKNSKSDEFITDAWF
ncbi:MULTISPECIES: competence pheromone ComX [unclassified Paenibacillus]|jgi:hypothetical protein|uniref:competence pheromone ComX n=1 Tax=unclassified Paenibacillus TaxID=185978 RepID=UPI000A8A01B6|nr:competence pheromone ComX [Paenibacillus sp. FSL H7-0737]